MGDVVRQRRSEDMDALIDLAQIVQRVDGYPGRQPRDFRAFLASPDALGAWVVDVDGEVAGHVALHRSSLPVVMDRAAEFLGAEPDGLGVVARLFVDPGARRQAVGRRLLAAAADQARALGLRPILDVVTDYSAANGLYRACGWHNAGEITMEFSDGTTLQSFVWVAPT